MYSCLLLCGAGVLARAAGARAPRADPQAALPHACCWHPPARPAATAACTASVCTAQWPWWP
eukprot:10246369-Lingulodinium_polyedra.AAC.1